MDRSGSNNLIGMPKQSCIENLTKDDTNHITNYVHSFLTLINHEDDLTENGRLPKCKMTQQKKKATKIEEDQNGR